MSDLRAQLLTIAGSLDSIAWNLHIGPYRAYGADSFHTSISQLFNLIGSSLLFYRVESAGPQSCGGDSHIEAQADRSRTLCTGSS